MTRLAALALPLALLDACAPAHIARSACQSEMLSTDDRWARRVGYRDLGGEKHVVVTPEAPAFVEMQTRLHRERRSFSLYFEPLDGHAEGLKART